MKTEQGEFVDKASAFPTFYLLPCCSLDTLVLKVS